MTVQEIEVLKAIGSGVTSGLDNAIVAKLAQLGLVYGDQGTAGLFVTINGRSLLEAHGRKDG